MRDYSKINDRFGGVDKNILKPVEVLNKAGLLTIGSCEGHLGHRNPTPYIMFNFRKKNNPILKDEDSVKKYIKNFNKTQTFKYKTSKLTFSKTQLGDDYVIISNKKLSDKFNKQIELNIKRRETGLNTIPYKVLNKEEITVRKLELKEEQRVINSFSKYIENIFKDII